MIKNAWAASLAPSPREVIKVFVVERLLRGLHHGGLHLTFGQESLHLSLELVELIKGAAGQVELGIKEAHLVIDPGLSKGDGVLGSIILGDHDAVEHLVVTSNDDLVIITLTAFGVGLDFFSIVTFVKKSMVGIERGEASNQPFGGNLQSILEAKRSHLLLLELCKDLHKDNLFPWWLIAGSQSHIDVKGTPNCHGSDVLKILYSISSRLERDDVEAVPI